MGQTSDNRTLKEKILFESAFSLFENAFDDFF